MSIKNDVLKILEEHRGDFLSGEEIAGALNVSRTSVWKAIKTLQDEGYEIAAGKNRGYSLSVRSDLLSEPGIRQFLRGDALGYCFEVHKELESTNTTAKQRAAEGAVEGTVVVSEFQSGGKGRGNRSFFSPSQSGIYMSLILRPALQVGSVQLITTAAAVSVARAIENVSGKATSVKWVNDIFMEEKKVCGILTEVSFSPENGEVDYAVLGIGINVYPPEGGFPEEISEIAGAIQPECPENFRNRLIAEVWNLFSGYYRSLESKEFYEEYRRRLNCMDRPIRIHAKGEVRNGRAVALDRNFNLHVEYDDGSTETLIGGEVSIRR